jgi:hypothetical protein
VLELDRSIVIWQSSDGVCWYIDVEFPPESLAYYPRWPALVVARYVHTTLDGRVSLYALIARKIFQTGADTCLETPQEE